MGNASSVSHGLQMLAHISGAHAVPLQDSAWTALAVGSPILAEADPAAVEREIRPHTASLVYNNTQTLNCQRLLYLVAQHLTNSSPPASAANAVHVLRAIVKDLIEQLNSEQLRTFVELPPAALQSVMGAALQAEFAGLHQGSLVATLCRAALGTLSSAPDMTAGEYLLQFEVVNLLLVLASSQLYTPHARATPGAHPFLEALMQQADLAPAATQALLLAAMRSTPAPSGLRLYRPSGPQSVLRTVRSAAASVLLLPYTAVTMLLRRGGPRDGAATPLADAAEVLLLALRFHPARADAGGGGGSNPFRNALKKLQDTDDRGADAAAEGGVGGAGGAGVAAVPYAALYDALGRTLVSRESSVLLLYVLLHGTPHFEQYCLARSDLDTLLLPLLELLYGAPSRSANQLYMLLIILLILSQEPAFAQQVHRVSLPAVPFYKERSLANTTLGSLLVVLLLRTAHHNSVAGKDVYLHTNTLATLANLAPHMSGLSPHAAQRLVSLFHLLARRYARLQRQEAAAAAPGQVADAAAAAAAADSDPRSEADAERLALELQLYSDFLRIVLEIVNAILASSLPANPELVYALLHRQEVFEPFRGHPRYGELAKNVFVVIEHFGRRLDEALGGVPAGNVDAQRVLDLIKLHSRGWRKDRLQPVPELRFSYEEEASPEEFFVPYVWSLAVAQPQIPWTLPAIALFTPTLVNDAAAAGADPAALSPAPSIDTPLQPGAQAPNVAANV